MRDIIVFSNEKCDDWKILKAFVRKNNFQLELNKFSFMNADARNIFPSNKRQKKKNYRSPRSTTQDLKIINELVDNFCSKRVFGETNERIRSILFKNLTPQLSLSVRSLFLLSSLEKNFFNQQNLNNSIHVIKIKPHSLFWKNISIFE